MVHPADNQAIPLKARALANSNMVEARRQLLHAHHIAPLTAYVAELRARHPDWEFPDFDPLDGGIEADLLFLLEKPGPKTSPENKGSGFISRDNNDPTAHAIFEQMEKANIDRRRTVLWNTVPGWNRTRAIAAGEVKAGLQELHRLLELLPALRTVVLVGRKAQRAEAILRTKPLRLFHSAHPSPLVRGPNPAMWNQIHHQWAEAAAPY